MAAGERRHEFGRDGGAAGVPAGSSPLAGLFALSACGLVKPPAEARPQRSDALQRRRAAAAARQRRRRCRAGEALRTSTPRSRAS